MITTLSTIKEIKTQYPTGDLPVLISAKKHSSAMEYFN